MSHRRIACRLGIARTTVQSVVSGRWAGYRRLDTSPERLLGDAGSGARLRRCPGCGRRVEMPCVACRAEQERRRLAQLRRSAAAAGLPAVFEAAVGRGVRLGVELVGEQRRRYEAIRASKENQEQERGQ